MCIFTFMHVVILLCCRTLCVLDVRLLSDTWFANTVILVPFYSLPFHSVNSVLWCSPVYQVFAFAVWYVIQEVVAKFPNLWSFDTVFLYSFLCQRIDMGRFDLIGLEGRVSRYEADTFLPQYRLSRRVLLEVATAPDPPPRPKTVKMKVNRY